jgi:hypothetical protein
MSGDVHADEIRREAEEPTTASSGGSVARSSVDVWPRSLRAVAYSGSGIIGQLALLIEPHTEADPAALLVQLTVMFGNCIGRTAHIRVEADVHHCNLFAVLVGETAKGRKGTSEGRARAPFRLIDEEWTSKRIVEGLSSGEGLIYQVRDPIEIVQPVKHRGRVIDYDQVIEDAGVTDKRLLVRESEFASTLRVIMREGNTLSPTIRRAWDGHDLGNLTKSPARATEPHVSIIGHVTGDEVRRYLDRTELANGFANRFLFVCVRRSKLLPHGGGTVDLTEPVKTLQAAVDHARRAGELRFDRAADALWCDRYERLSAGRPGLLGAVTGRAEAQVRRLSCVFAVADRSSAITRTHLQAALEMWRYCFASARYVFGGSLGDPVADEILSALRRTPDGLTRSDILHRVFGRNRSASDIGRALALLERAGLARHRVDEETGGRPAERWCAIAPDDINEKDDISPEDEPSCVVNVVNVVAPDAHRGSGNDAAVF